MNPNYRNQKKVKKVPLPPYLATPRPCLDSLRLPISRPCQYHPVTRPAVITSSCYQSCTEKLPVCHCVNACSNSNSCKRSNPYICPHGFNHQNVNRENVEENGNSDEEFCDNNEFIGNVDKINFEKDLGPYQENRSDKIPLRDSFLNTYSKLNNTVPDNIANELDQSSRVVIDSKYENKDVNTCCFKNQDNINSNTNKTIFVDPEFSGTNKNMNVDTSNFHINNQSVATPEVHSYKDGDQVRNDMSLTGFHRRYLQSSQDLNKSSQPTMFGSAPQLSQADLKNLTNESVLTQKNDASNQCCFPPYIHAAQPDTSKDFNHTEEDQSLKKQGQSSIYFNNSNGQREQNSNKNMYESTATSHLRINDNISRGNINETKTIEKNRFSKISQSTNMSDKRHKSLQISSSHDQMTTDLAYDDHTSFPESSYKGFLSKARCCKGSENSKQNIQDKMHDDNFSNNNHYPGYLHNQTKLIPDRRTQLSGDPNYDNKCDFTAEQSYRQGSDHYNQGLYEFDPKNTNRKSEYKRNKSIQKSSVRYKGVRNLSPVSSKLTSYLSHVRAWHADDRECGDSFTCRHGLLMHVAKTHRSPPENSVYPSIDRYGFPTATLNQW
ncbi:probable serine/threonine-protein kinase clkA [Melitaea cinxia]|uniref:probable serine/threonine-protein kinase clkA n=1 Tax=Melitaea cinxia TaxID=113334 RepID=UPI001E273C7B|nr:probable serine/threonine-protein kinase clkA [Melitaea cinxia]